MIFLLSCLNTEPYEKRWAEIRDFDQDGISAEAGDCDDEDPMISPEADEICDGLDNNCDGIVDEDAINRRYWGFDLDLDGYAQEIIEESCFQSSSQLVDVLGDCDDTNPLVFPQAAETWQDAFVDNDCDEQLEKMFYDLDSKSIPLELLADSAGPIILNDFEIFKIAYPGGDGDWYFYRSEEILFREAQQAAEGLRGVGFQNQVALEFRNEQRHWLGFYSEFDILSQSSLSLSNAKILLPIEEIQALEASDDELLAIAMGNQEETTIYIIDSIPSEDKEISEVSTSVTFSHMVEKISWVSGFQDSEMSQLVVKIKNEHIFLEKEGAQWIPVFTLEEDCDKLLQVKGKEFICSFEEEIIFYMLDGEEEYQGSKTYEVLIEDIFILDIQGEPEPFVILKHSDSSGYISYSLHQDEIAIFSSAERKLRALSPLLLDGEQYFAYWDQLHKELLMVLIPSRG